jgi:hypothetical protein
MGRLLNGNYSAYLVPSNVRIPEADVVFTGDFDHEASLPRQESARRADRRTGSARDRQWRSLCDRHLVRNLPITVETLL